MSEKTESKEYRRGAVSGHPIFGCIKDIRENSLEFFDRCHSEGDIVSFRLAHRKVFGVHHPDLVKEVLLNNYENFVKRGIYARLRPVFRKGLITSMGNLWKKQRRTMQPIFSRRNMEAMVLTIESEVRGFRDDLLQKSDQNQPVDLFEEMLNVTLRIVTATMFSDDVSDRHQEVSEHVYFLNKYITKLLYSIAPPLPWLPTASNRQYTRSMKALDGIVLELVEKRRRDNNFGDDLLGMLLSSKDPETGESMSDEQIRDEAITIFIAGHETTATALTWTYHLLNNNPEIRDKMHGLIDGCIPGESAPLTYDVIKQLDYVEHIFLESLRVKPAVCVIYREAASDCELGGAKVRKGDSVYVSPYVSNQDERFWKNPQKFDPSRFSDEGDGQKNKFVFFPFGAGPRSCIGSHFALLEARMIFAILGKSLYFDSDDKSDAVPEPLVTMKPRDPLMMNVVRRGANA